MDQNSVQSIIDALAGMAERKEVIPPQTWMEAASKINVLLQGEQEKKYEMEHHLAQIKAEILGEGRTSAFAKSMVEATTDYLDYKKHTALIERAKETILLAKKNAQLASDLMRNQLD